MFVQVVTPASRNGSTRQTGGLTGTMMQNMVHAYTTMNRFLSRYNCYKVLCTVHISQSDWIGLTKNKKNVPEYVTPLYSSVTMSCKSY